MQGAQAHQVSKGNACMSENRLRWMRCLSHAHTCFKGWVLAMLSCLHAIMLCVAPFPLTRPWNRCAHSSIRHQRRRLRESRLAPLQGLLSI